MPGGKKAQSRDLAAIALASGQTTAEAATAAGVAERTVFAWKNEQGFSQRVTELRNEAINRACGELSDGMTEAARVLRKLLTSETESIKLRAAAELLNSGLKVMELTQVVAEQAKLREEIAQLRQHMERTR